LGLQGREQLPLSVNFLFELSALLFFLLDELQPEPFEFLFGLLFLESHSRELDLGGISDFYALLECREPCQQGIGGPLGWMLIA
jgi:hypothetical protein